MDLQVIIDCGVLQRLVVLLLQNHDSYRVRCDDVANKKHAFWIMSNIIVNAKEQISAVIQEGG